MGYFINKDGEIEKAKPVKLTSEQRKKYLRQTPEQKKMIEEIKKRKALMAS
jgi:hypothetical protein